MIIPLLIAFQIAVPTGCQVITTDASNIVFTPCSSPPNIVPDLCHAAPTGLPPLPAASLPALPQSCWQPVYPTQFSSTTQVSTFATLQAAVSTAKCGAHITLAPGIYSGNLVYPELACGPNSMVLVEAADMSMFPQWKQADRTLAGSPKIPIIAPPGNTSALNISDGASGFYFAGIEFTLSAASKGVYTIVGMGERTTTVAGLPHYAAFDRVLITPAPCLNDSMAAKCNYVARGIDLNAVNGAVIFSSIWGIVQPGQDTQAININNTTGPGLIAGDYLEATGENLMFNTSCTKTDPGQGSTGWQPGDDGIQTCPVPSDWTVRLNHFRKLMAWQSLPAGCNPAAAQCYTVKNLFEIKYGARILADSNVLDTTFSGGQQSAIISNCFYSGIYVCRDWTFTNSLIEHVPTIGAVAGNGMPALCGASNQPPCGSDKIQAGVGFLFRNNLAVDVDGIKYGGAQCNAATGQNCASGIAFQFQNSNGITLDHYTVINRTSLYQNGLNFTDAQPSTDQNFRASYGMSFGSPFNNGGSPGWAISGLPNPTIISPIFVGDYWQHANMFGVEYNPKYPAAAAIVSLTSTATPVPGSPSCVYNNYPLQACWPLDWALVGILDFAGCNAGTNLAGCALQPSSPYRGTDNGMDTGANIPALLSAISSVQ